MAGTIKLDGATFLEKDGGNYKITNTELKLKSSGNTIVDSSGNAVLSESGGNVSIGSVRLPAAGGIKDSSGNNVLAESSGTVTLQGADFVPNTPMMFRNKLINGNFDFWQRGPYQTSSGYGSADRWQNYHDTSTKTASQQAFTVGQTDVPGNPKYYLRHVITTGGGANDRVLTNQKIEDVSTLAGKTLSFSFWAKADSAKNIAIEVVQNFGTGGSPSSAVTGIGVTTHSLTTSWQKFTGTVSIPSISGKTIGSDGNDYMSFSFWFDAGSTYNSRTNSLGNQSGTFDIAQVQLEEGSAATPFEQRPYAIEYPLVGRYFQFFTTHSFSEGMPNLLMENRASATELRGILYFDAPMRVLPSFQIKGNGVFSGNVQNFESIYALSVNTGMAPLSVSSFTIRPVNDNPINITNGINTLPRTGKRPEGISAAWFTATLNTSSYQSNWRLSGSYENNTGILLDAEL